ncbi:unnamed protein product [Rhizophagus irregularis]|uniref:Uncharacterized protein n=1 Tax=Rhizophagus irregularis TaxID=588596 RepID=A0A2I1GP55_9GLOM|nr:hypothetical protein RhiirA4_404395 [Rhizophagus irregularis]CAB4446310.1 unnamed protein product [Rhizophagus irregularis]
MFRPCSPPKLVAYVLIVMLIISLMLSLTLGYLTYLVYMNWSSLCEFLTKSTICEISEMLIYTENQEHITRFIGSKAVTVYL